MTTVVSQVGQTMDVTAGAAKSAGDVEEFANSIGVWLADTENAAAGAVLMEGVVTLAKETGVAFSQGDMLYWDAANDRLDKTATNIPAGLCWADAASGDTTASVKLNSGAAAPVS